ncbi:hypothetical protein G6F22_015702 [Rhizopus arrhizus]|nr:hypothetical protein G6F22_015702 [Rhizopus arrhizus]
MANYRKVGDLAGARAFLSEMTEHYRGIAPVLALTRLMEEQEGVAPARAYLGRQLKDRPSVRGESALIDLTLAEGADSTATLHDLKHITDQLLVLPELQGVGDGQAAAELRGALIHAVVRDGGAAGAGPAERSPDLGSPWLCRAAAVDGPARRTPQS